MRTVVQGLPRHKNNSKTTKTKRAAGVVKMVECLPSKHQALSSTSSAKNNKKFHNNEK
jgi:hypothetical protein